MITQRAAFGRRLAGTTTSPPGSPSATSSTGAIRRRDRPADLLDEHVFSDAVDGVDRVALVLARHAGQRCRPPPVRTRCDDVAADAPVQRLNGREQRMVGAGVTRSAERQVVRPAGRDELGGLLLRRRVAEEVAAANLRAGEVLEQIRPAQRRMELDVEVEACRRPLSIGAWWSAITYGNGIRQRLSKRMTTSRSTVARSRRSAVVQIGDRRHAPQRRDVGLVGIARKIRHERDRAAMLADDAAPVLLLGREDVLEERAGRSRRDAAGRPAARSRCT